MIVYVFNFIVYILSFYLVTYFMMKKLEKELKLSQRTLIIPKPYKKTLIPNPTIFMDYEFDEVDIDNMLACRKITS